MMTVRQEAKDRANGNEAAFVRELKRLGIPRYLIDEDLPDVQRKFRYDAATGHVWFISGRETGKIASNLSLGGYITVPMWERNHPAHRVAWLLTHGRLPLPNSGFEIDHINGDTTDNRLVNLRECTHAQNIMNAKVRSDNALGITGVYFCRKERRYIAVIRDAGKTRRLGAFDELAFAVKARQEAAELVYGKYRREQ